MVLAEVIVGVNLVVSQREAFEVLSIFSTHRPTGIRKDVAYARPLMHIYSISTNADISSQRNPESLELVSHSPSIPLLTRSHDPTPNQR